MLVIVMLKPKTLFQVLFNIWLLTGACWLVCWNLQRARYSFSTDPYIQWERVSVFVCSMMRYMN